MCVHWKAFFERSSKPLSVRGPIPCRELFIYGGCKPSFAVIKGKREMGCEMDNSHIFPMSSMSRATLRCYTQLWGWRLETSPAGALTP